MTLVVDASVVVAALIDDGEAGRWARPVLARRDVSAPAFIVLAEPGARGG